jgi:hypothetical protein
MEKESQSARQQDTSKLKEGLPGMFAYYFTVPSHEAPIPPVPRDKTGRGFNHFYTARALCPRAYSYSFDNEEGYVTRLPFFRSNTSTQVSG